MGKYVMKQVKNGYHFTLAAGNGEVIGSSEVYATRDACLSGVESVRRNAPAASVEDQTQDEKKPHPKFEVYLDKAGEFRFRLKAGNGEIILVSEGYAAKEGCKKGIASVVHNADSPVAEETPGE